MHCHRCGVKMMEQKRTYHKRRKWICRICGTVRMQEPKKGKKDAEKERS
jgi:hypothetical protein